jgi:hypothetical protein
MSREEELTELLKICKAQRDALAFPDTHENAGKLKSAVFDYSRALQAWHQLGENAVRYAVTGATNRYIEDLQQPDRFDQGKAELVRGNIDQLIGLLSCAVEKELQLQRASGGSGWLPVAGGGGKAPAGGGGGQPPAGAPAGGGGGQPPAGGGGGRRRRRGGGASPAGNLASTTYAVALTKTAAGRPTAPPKVRPGFDFGDYEVRVPPPRGSTHLVNPGVADPYAYPVPEANSPLLRQLLQQATPTPTLRNKLWAALRARAYDPENVAELDDLARFLRINGWRANAAVVAAQAQQVQTHLESPRWNPATVTRDLANILR